MAYNLKTKTPEQLAQIKANKAASDKRNYQRKKAGFPPVQRPPKMTEEQRKARFLELQKIRRGKEPKKAKVKLTEEEKRETKNKYSREYYELNKKPLLTPEQKKPRVGKLAGLTPEQAKERRLAQKRLSAAKLKLDNPKPAQPTQPRKARKLPIGRKEKPAPKRMANRPEDPNKVKVKLKPGLWVMADTNHPEYSFEKLLIKYKIAI